MSEFLSKEECETTVKNLIDSSKFVLKHYEFKSLGEKKKGFMGNHFKMTATVLFDGKIQQLKFFAKFLPTSEGHRNVVMENNIFGKEVDAYKTLVPKLEAFLPKGVRLPVPRCYFIRDSRERVRVAVPGSPDEGVIILEDANHLGYTLQENFPPLDIPHCHVALKSLAKFHAASILLEQSYKKSHPNVDVADSIYSCAKEFFLILNKGGFGYEWSKGCASTMATAVVNIWPDRFQGKREKILETVLERWTQVFSMAQPSRKYTNVLNHGDVWTNNMMFKYRKEQESGKVTPEDAIFVDLQLVRYAPPILDILLYLHVSGRRDFREQNLKELLKYYHDSLKEFAPPELIDDVLPFSSLFESCDGMRDFGRVMCCGYVPIILLENDPGLSSHSEAPTEPLDVVNVLFNDNGEKVWKNCKLSENYKERIEETFRECLEGLSLWENE